MKRKWLVVGIILLFIGVTIAPTININTVKASQEIDLVEVTTQACGIQGYGDNTVKLTRQQYQDLEQYLVEFRARLNQTSTREEAVPLFKEAVVELNKYGLLPKGMSVQQTSRLVTAPQTNPAIEKLMNILTSYGLSFSNNFCLLTMYSVVPDNDVLFGLLTLPLAVMLMLIFVFHSRLIFAPWLIIPFFLSAIIGVPSLYFNNYSPVLLWSIVVINSGFVGFSLGLKGVQQINQNIEYLIGYKGLRLWFPVGGYDEISFYLGQAFGIV